MTYPASLPFRPAASARLPHSPVAGLNFPVQLKASDRLPGRKKSLDSPKVPTLRVIEGLRTDLARNSPLAIDAGSYLRLLSNT
ncbi:MAG: hypothetical protein ABS69_02300 [Nitrosomonadales bacterium SCN 54-20]|nr:MAG: hypothetical protein ABS69_02300 [Nitrosomonadales bacterium SCN 54-20]